MDQPRRIVVLYEPNHGGHRLKYVALLLETFLATHRVVIATTREAVNSVEYRELLAKHAANFELHIIPDRDVADNSLKARFIDTWYLVRYLSRLKQAELVFIPYLDSVFFPFGLLGLFRLARVPRIEGILLRGDYAYLDPRFFKVRLKNLLAVWIVKHGPFSRTLCIDELLYSHFTPYLAGSSGRFCYCPDPVESVDCEKLQDDFRARLGIPADARVIGSFGNIDERKGIDRLVRAFVAYGPSPREYLLLVGKQSDGVRRTLAELQGRHQKALNIVSLDGFVSDDEMLSAMNSCDTVATLYPRHVGSASIVIRAAAMKKPVLGTDFGWIGRAVREYGLGCCFDVYSESSLVRGIGWGFNTARIDLEKAARFTALHSVENFSQVILAGSSKPEARKDRNLCIYTST
jgi:glycosyltransferase involved in cell wall biosynthesis